MTDYTTAGIDEEAPPLPPYKITSSQPKISCYTYRNNNERGMPMERKLHTHAMFKIVVVMAMFAALFAPLRQWILASVGF